MTKQTETTCHICVEPRDKPGSINCSGSHPRKATEDFRCGWCGCHCSTLEDKIIHEAECPVMIEEMEKEAHHEQCRQEQWRQFEEEERAAGRI